MLPLFTSSQFAVEDLCNLYVNVLNFLKYSKQSRYVMLAARITLNHYTTVK
uniref:Uncharacterized protein n=1 Tax=Anguilla anguilla TaxID=7936 RepID=A0A0E9WW94_ANGAN